MRSKVIFVFLLLSLILFYGCSEQQDKNNFSVPSETEISGEISVDTVWSLDKSPYIVVDDVLVQRGVTLTIEPQVEIRFERDKGLTVLCQKEELQ